MPEALRIQLIEHIERVQAKERHVLSLLDSLIGSADDSESVEQLETQKQETANRERVLRERLNDLGSGPQSDESSASQPPRLERAVGGQNGGQEARAGYVVEHLTVSYEMLERLAEQANDEKTARIARRNRTAKEGTAQKIANNWDRITRSSRFDGWFS